MLKFFSKNKQSISNPKFINEYLNNFSTNVNPNKKIIETEFIVFDIESSGLDVKSDCILSIGAVKLNNNKIDVGSSLELFISQEIDTNESVFIHGILSNGKELKISEHDAIERYLRYIGTSVLVGHNVDFDITMINKTLLKYGNVNLKNKVLDTRNLYLRVKGGENVPSKSLALDTLCEEFEISKSDRHTAAGDAFITGILFLKLLNRLEKRGVKSLNELLRNHKKLF